MRKIAVTSEVARFAIKSSMKRAKDQVSSTRLPLMSGRSEAEELLRTLRMILGVNS